MDAFRKGMGRQPLFYASLNRTVGWYGFSVMDGGDLGVRD